MEKKNSRPELTRTELDVLKVLWKQGKLSAREIHERLSPARGWAYSTTRTTLDRMARKGLLKKQDYHGIYLYMPCITKVAGIATLVRNFAEHVLELDPAPVVSLFAHSHALTAEEVAELSRLLDGEENPS